ncbi:phosphopentomutase [Clostridium sp. MSJ-8]|uniref:phosphopentomutase n=1 Tax=Clostridium sp. MSJ-8 TaxID=2841510 RepID=UPI001C0EF05D|nr:phosphopentomutase [Clostridium sp. MSJ-8]MBU5486965.1 phosphopentomutase [Clostridium sp. MSJ-8]
MSKRCILIVLDSVGIGEMPDAKQYGDEGSNTLGNIYKVCGGMDIPNLISLGLGNIEGGEILGHTTSPKASYGKAKELSKGKDTVTGHWEISGVVLKTPLTTYPNGFPEDIIVDFKKRANVAGILGNKVASGTKIIEELGEEHIKTGYPIIYTSADSVFQIAAHEEVIKLDDLYNMCKAARELLVGDRTVGRVIARPFITENGKFKRTANRRDYALDPFGKTILEYISEDNKHVACVGKIEDIFNKKGVTEAIHIKDNMDGVDKTIEYMNNIDNGLIFTNLVDFDMLYGHRNDPEGYKKALEDFDRRLPEIIDNLKEEDMLIITADHGCDPTTASTDHSREYIPILVYGTNIKSVSLGIRDTFSDIGKTILDYLEIDNELENGTSFLSEIK